jgi:hypothetical protein
MPEPEAEAITGGPTPEPPQDAPDIARKLKRDTKGEPLPEKAKTAASELDLEVSGEYEAKQERDAADRTRRRRASRATKR